MASLRIPFFAALISLACLSFVASASFDEERGVPLLHVDFLDVGQGDATFIESPSGTQVLIDGGRDGSVLRDLSSVMGFFDRDIDMVVATHPDLDHIGGLAGVLKRYAVRTIVLTENVKSTPEFEEFLRAVRDEGATVVYARRGDVFDLGAGPAGTTTLSVLFPDRDPSGLESNTSSIVTELRYGTTGYVMTGDSPREIEEYLVSLGTSTLRSDVLKVGHHGSRTSSSPIFLDAVHPTYAIISAGKNNSYGHPHKEVVDLLDARGITRKNTADVGSIFSSSDGVTVSVR